MRTTANLGLTVWNLNSDTFDPSQLAANWDTIDAKFSSSAVSNTPIRYLEGLSSIVASGTEGRIGITTAATGGFAKDTVIRYSGTSWRTVGPTEIVSTLPTSNNWAGRTVILSAAVGGFNAWDMVVNTDGANTWAEIGKTQTSTTVAGFTNNYAGKLGVLTAADSGFNAYSLLLYNGSSWALVGPQAIPPATELVYSTISTDITTTSGTDPGGTLLTFSTATFENVKYYLNINIPRIKASVTAGVEFRLREGASNIGNPIEFDLNTSYQSVSALFPFTPSAGSHTYYIDWWITSPGTLTINTTNLAPAIFRIIKA